MKKEKSDELRRVAALLSSKADILRQPCIFGPTMLARNIDIARDLLTKYEEVLNEKEEFKPQPCPVCGGDAAIGYSDEPGFMWIQCERSGCEMEGPADEDEQSAIDKWNRLRYDKGGEQ